MKIPKNMLLSLVKKGVESGEIAFANRFADPEEWPDPTMEVEEISEERADKIVVSDEDGDSRRCASSLLAEQRAVDEQAYLAGTCW